MKNRKLFSVSLIIKIKRIDYMKFVIFFCVFLIITGCVSKSDKLIKQGNEQLRNKKAFAAIVNYNKAIEKNPKNAKAFYMRGGANFYLKKYNQAIEDFNKAIKLNSNNEEIVKIYVIIGNCYSRLDNKEKAFDNYSTAIELKPAQYVAYMNRGSILCGMNKFKKAIADFNKAIELFPNNPSLYLNRAFAYYKLKDYKAALEDYNKAIKTNPKGPAYAYSLRGKTNLELGNHAQALKDFDKVSELSSNFNLNKERKRAKEMLEKRSKNL